MDPFKIAKEALRNLWVHKYLWFFGLFVAGGGGAGGPPPGGKGGAGGGQLPGWLIPALIAASVFALAMLCMHVVSEAALIEGVRRNRAGEPFRIGTGMRVGLRHFWRVLGVKLLLAAVFLGSGLVLVAPTVLAVLGLVPWWLAVLLTLPLAVVAVPWFLSVYFVYEYALRVAVLDTRGPVDAVREARSFLHGRVLDSLKLLLVAFLGQMGGGLVAAALLVPVAGLGLLVYLAAGLVPAIAVAAALVLPVALTVMGALGTFRSSVWTLGFIDGRAGEAA
ncbi:MAG: hypothetical protein ACYC8T_01265 [Myxococcaceae bacterium]